MANPPDPEGDRRRVEDIDDAPQGGTRENRKTAAEQRGKQRNVAPPDRRCVSSDGGYDRGPFGRGFLGYWLDRWLGWAPWSLVTGLVLGFVAGVNNAWRAIRAYSRDANQGRGSDEERRLP